MSATAKAAAPKTSAVLKSSCNVRKDGRMTKRQIDVLTFLRKHGKPSTYADILRSFDLKTDSPNAKTVRWALGSIRDAGSNDPASLMGRGFVKQRTIQVEEGIKDQMYEATKSGLGALSREEKLRAEKTATNGKE